MSWAHINMLGEYDFSDEKLRDSVGILTDAGGKRRQAHTIKAGDTLKLVSQKSMFFMFSGLSKKD